METTDRFDDNSRLSDYKSCPRKYFLRHVMDWRSEGTAIPLVFGLSWHSAMDAVWQFSQHTDKATLVQAAMANFQKTWEEEGLTYDLDLEQIEALTPRTPGVAEEMLHSYIDERWPVLSKCKLLAYEQPFAVPLPGLTGCWYAGRLDKVIEYQGQTLVIEHKTSTEYAKASGFRSTYIESWYSDAQVKGYQFGGNLYWPGLSQVWVDAALVHKAVHNAFRFIPISHAFPLLKEWLDDTQEWVRRVQNDEHRFAAAGNRLVHGVFPKNEGQCMGKYGACPFLDICRTTADPSALEEPPAGYMVEKWSPFDELGLAQILNKGST